MQLIFATIFRFFFQFVNKSYPIGDPMIQLYERYTSTHIATQSNRSLRNNFHMNFTTTTATTAACICYSRHILLLSLLIYNNNYLKLLFNSKRDKIVNK